MTERLERTVFARLEAMGDVPLLWWKGEWWSVPRFLDRTRSCIETLERGGFGEGQRLAFMAPNSPLSLSLSLAAWSLGGSVAPLNPLGGGDLLLSTLKTLEPSLLVVPDSADQAPRLASSGLPVAMAWGAGSKRLAVGLRSGELHVHDMMTKVGYVE